MSIPEAWKGVEAAWLYKLRHLGDTPKLGDLVRVPGREEGRPWKWVDLGRFRQEGYISYCLPYL